MGAFESIQWQGNNISALGQFCKEHYYYYLEIPSCNFVMGSRSDSRLFITLHLGDYAIKTADGEIFKCDSKLYNKILKRSLRSESIMKEEVFKSKSCDFSAVQFDGDNKAPIIEFLADSEYDSFWQDNVFHLVIDGHVIKLYKGDWVVKKNDEYFTLSETAFKTMCQSADGERFSGIVDAITKLEYLADNEYFEHKAKIRQLIDWLYVALGTHLFEPTYSLTATVGWERVADTYGEKQIFLLIEEMGELTQALTKYLRYNEGGQPVRKSLSEVKSSITEEYADVLIMLIQIKHLLNIKDEDVDAISEKKLKRTFDIINGDNKYE
jgi:NTP pyrophosphatase (non-canonical NTP hydrolase)